MSFMQKFQNLYFVTVQIPSNYFEEVQSYEHKGWVRQFYNALTYEEQIAFFQEKFKDFSFHRHVYELTKKSPRMHLHGHIYLSDGYRSDFKKICEQFCTTHQYQIDYVLNLIPVFSEVHYMRNQHYMNKTLFPFNLKSQHSWPIQYQSNQIINDLDIQATSGGPQ